MKKILILLIALNFAIIGCSHKKKGILLPFLTLLNQDAGASAAKSESSAGTATASNGGSVVIVDNAGGGNNSGNAVLPNNNSDASSNSQTSVNNSSSSSSSSGNSNSSSSSGSSSNSGSNSNSNSGSDGNGSNSGSSNTASNTGSSSSSGNDTSSGSSSGNDTNTNNSGSSNTASNTGSGSSSGNDTNTNNNSESSNTASNTGSSSGNDTNTNNSGSSNTASNTGSSSGSDTSSGAGSNNGSSTNTPPAQEITGVITVNDQIGSIPFTYNTVQTIPLNLVITDKQSKPVSGATVIVSDNEGHILFQGISNNVGKVSGTITVETALGQITLEITAGGESISNVINLINVVGINREIKYEILLPAVATAPTDTDKDGVPDTLDTYPQDPTRSSLIRIPAEGVSTVAYEDLYPSAGDADLNDYVLHIHNEEDLNAAGDVIRLRGTYQHVARGAGYKHTFFLKLPVAVGATFSRKVVRDDGKVVTDLTTKTVSSSDLNQGIQIHEESNKTTSNPNVNPGGVYKPGYIATIEIVFNSPVKKTVLGSYPYDIFIKVTNTGKEIHFPGLYKNANGTDKYLDSNNFPWAILVPGAWKYPYEGLDIRKDAQSGYKEFNLWVASNGTSYKDWYKHVTNQTKVFPVPDEDSELMGFLLRSIKKNAILIAILLIGAGAAVAYILKRRTISQA
ncbi:LruC domain-containing protein [Leptospira noguchii]|uniref:LruC domain-containing protein n=1 Tax=Leptospira noguchii TaxID=28182 RepID=A0A9Q8RLE1_9LEPT|nr:LruC domain-containing protein [Leptospira noguchii]TQE70486.1 LruC domain-containing protein [Leptospira noguchii]UOG51756.1 LruC domain-containing protein [Leptospira noguchii]UOG57563.1 LruC domain-containing protein [Leptospira noguchii]